jgi:ribosome-binding factor A
MRASTRTARLANAIRESVAMYLVTQAHDPRLAGVVITDCRVTPDLRLASVYFHSLDEKCDKSAIHAALTGASGRLKAAIQDHVRLRFMPDLRFFYDDTLDSARRIETILHSIAQERNNVEPTGPADPTQ